MPRLRLSSLLSGTLLCCHYSAAALLAAAICRFFAGARFALAAAAPARYMMLFRCLRQSVYTYGYLLPCYFAAGF